jgi:hypothetical protein
MGWLFVTNEREFLRPALVLLVAFSILACFQSWMLLSRVLERRRRRRGYGEAGRGVGSDDEGEVGGGEEGDVYCWDGRGEDEEEYYYLKTKDV